MPEQKSLNRAKIRKAVAGDLPKVKACAHEAYLKYLERMGRKPPPMVADFDKLICEGLVYIVYSNLDLYGYAVFYPKGSALHLENVAVYPKYQGCGLGRKLVAFVEERAKDCGCTAVELYTNAKMHENIAWYEKLGYEITARRTESGLERVYFMKKI